MMSVNFYCIPKFKNVLVLTCHKIGATTHQLHYANMQTLQIEWQLWTALSTVDGLSFVKIKSWKSKCLRDCLLHDGQPKRSGWTLALMIRWVGQEGASNMLFSQWHFHLITLILSNIYFAFTKHFISIFDDI